MVRPLPTVRVVKIRRAVGIIIYNKVTKREVCLLSPEHIL